MQRKPGFPVTNCSIKMPDSLGTSDGVLEDDSEQQQRRLQLINFGHSQWGFNNWSWTVTKQELDFVDTTNHMYTAGVVAFISITVKSLDIHRENIGYATSSTNNKGFAIYKSRKCAVTNGLRETLLSFGGSVATDLSELLDANKTDVGTAAPAEPLIENNQNMANKLSEVKNLNKNMAKKDECVVKKEESLARKEDCLPKKGEVQRSPQVNNAPANQNYVPPIAKTHPMPPTLPPAANRPRPAPPATLPRAAPNVSYVLPMMGSMVSPIYAPPRLPSPQFPNYYECGPWHFTYDAFDRHHGNVNLNFNIPPKNLVVNSRSGSVECKRGPEGEPLHYGPPPQNQGCWIKPTIFYDGFWTEQKVKKWVAEQVEKQFPDDGRNKSSPPDNAKS